MGLGLESGFELSVEALDHAVGLGVIGSGPSTLGTNGRHEVVPKL